MEEHTYLDKIPEEIRAHIWSYVWEDEKREVRRKYVRVLKQLERKTIGIYGILKKQDGYADEEDVYVHKIAERYDEERGWYLGAHRGRKTIYLENVWKAGHGTYMYRWLRYEISNIDERRWASRPVEYLMDGINIFDIE